MKDERWKKEHHIGQCYDVRFEAQFFALDDDQYLMLWMIQPSGRNWADDDGFGFSGDSSIVLYSVIQKNGEFAKAFELFSIDKTKYCHEFDRYMSK